jgi:hypothetical protein
MTDPVAAYRRAADVLAADEPTTDEVLQALAGLKTVRADVDRVERQLIGLARDQATPWPSIAGALGVASRQAAEQRWLRLLGEASRDPTRVRTARHEQRVVDVSYGETLQRLRQAAAEVYRRIESDHGWDDRHSRAALARTSLETAITAPPSALYALCRNAVEDFEQMPTARFPAGLATAIRRLRSAERAARIQG